jgi:hypothetical protein
MGRYKRVAGRTSADCPKKPPKRVMLWPKQSYAEDSTATQHGARVKDPKDRQTARAGRTRRGVAPGRRRPTRVDTLHKTPAGSRGVHRQESLLPRPRPSIVADLGHVERTRGAPGRSPSPGRRQIVLESRARFGVGDPRGPHQVTQKKRGAVHGGRERGCPAQGTPRQEPNPMWPARPLKHPPSPLRC